MESSILAQISRQDLRELSTPLLASITEVKPLSSYNWIEAPTPTIAVPGSPSLWSPPRASRQLKKDSGLIYIAQNAARHPDSPVEPLFRALYVVNPSFDIRSIDVVTDRNNIRKLLSFINPASTRNGLEAFTIHIEVVGNTAIFSREETATQEFIGPHEFRGFGHEFERAYTTNQISGSTGHHRILSYRFSDLNFIVRHETDGYVADSRTMASKEPESDNLSSILGSLSLSQTNNSPGTTLQGSKLTVKEEGEVVLLDSTLEIKTRVIHKPLEIQEVAPQLWISQTLKLVRAYHIRGTFQRTEVEDVATPIKTWEDRNQSDLRKLAALIKKIINDVKECGGNAMLRYDVNGDKLVIQKFDGKKMLPEDLYLKWSTRDKSEEEIDTIYDAGTEGNVKPIGGEGTKAEGKRIDSGPEDTKGKQDAEGVKLPDESLPDLKVAKETDLGSQNAGDEHQATTDSKGTSLSTS